MLECRGYLVEREKMFEEIRERCEVDIAAEENRVILNKMIGEGIIDKGKQMREIVLEYMKKANRIRKRYVD